MEEWRPISGYIGDYEVSSYGRVKSLKYNKERILKQSACTGGYLYVFLCKHNKVKSSRVHRLVANAFLDNPKGLPEVNHKDQNVANNRVENLEWATPEYNRAYGSRTERISESKKRNIVQIDLTTGEKIGAFKGADDAARAVGLRKASGIRSCCRGFRESAGGYAWRYEP